MTYYLAVDIGASSGRHILGHIEDGRIVLEEIYRFENGIKEENGALVWDVIHLFSEVKNGIAECSKLGKIPKTIAIDTWGVDYVLLDPDGKEIFPAVSYRDGRTVEALKEVENIISDEELYSITGIQKVQFNTIYQLYCDRVSGKLEKASRLLMIPEYLSYKLTGVAKNEYTNATTTALVDAEKKTWSGKVLDKLGIRKDVFGELSLPGDTVGEFLPEISSEVGFNATVLFAPSHDTASAVAACPLDEGSMYISSGTWSLVGTENLQPVLTSESQKANFTNEGGVEYHFRYLKNIMGMWLFQNIRKELKKDNPGISYDDMMNMAKESGFDETFDCNAPEIVAPKSMIEAIRNLLGKDLPIEDILSSVYYSLAGTYKAVADEIEKLSGKKIGSILIVGGGSKDKYLNELTSKVSGRTVVTGLAEATALGNLISQIMADKDISLAEGREIIKNSFEFKEIKA